MSATPIRYGLLCLGMTVLWIACKPSPRQHPSAEDRRMQEGSGELSPTTAPGSATGHWRRMVNQALINGTLADLRHLLARRVEINGHDSSGSTFLITAIVRAERNREKVIQLLLEHGADVNARDKKSRAPLYFAVSGDLTLLKLLLAKGARVDEVRSGRWSALHQACTMNTPLENVEFLLKSGADVNARSEDRSTPLHVAAFLGRADIVKMLVEHGASLTARDAQGLTPADIATESGNSRLFQL
jgi:ankyrin repeat protein